jgi:dihydroxyacetone kinase
MPRYLIELGDNEMELGLGIHGEPGAKRTHLRPADQLSATLLTEILRYGKFGDERHLAVMINNPRATTEMELAIVARHVLPFLEKKGFTVERAYAGTFVSSAGMAGISISLLGLNDACCAGLTQRRRLLRGPCGQSTSTHNGGASHDEHLWQ